MNIHPFLLNKYRFIQHRLLTKKHLKTIILWVWFTVISCPWQVAATSNTSNTLFFYNPESNINDFRSLKTLFDSYLSKHGTYSFQPFKNKKTFEKFLRTNQNGLFLLSSWHYQNLVEQGYANLKPLLVSTMKNQSTYTKVLSTKKTVKTLTKFQNRRFRIAAASHKNYTQSLLENMIAQQLNIHVKVIVVPKDIDALMSITFGVADGALTTRNSLKTLAKLNPRKSRILYQHTESPNILLPVIVAYKPISKSTQQFLNALERLSHSNLGKMILGTLGWDNLKKVTPAEIKFLKSIK
jgi:hypothetical protein